VSAKVSLYRGAIALVVNRVPILNVLQPGSDAAMTSIETRASKSFRLGYTASGAVIVFSPSDTSEERFMAGAGVAPAINSMKKSSATSKSSPTKCNFLFLYFECDSTLRS